jgi:NAD(P)H-quinone oxidoreductase subunit 5
MTSYLLWLVALGPLGLLAASLVPTSVANRNPKALIKAALLLSLLSFVGAVAALISAALQPSLLTPLIGIHGVGFSLYLDIISASMFTLVSFIGATVVLFSQNYLAGDPGHGRFTKLISVTLGSVLLLIIAGNLLQFFAAWVFTSLGLHRLLIFYSERPSAILAARKKWVVSRLGDLCLLTGLILIYLEVGSLEYNLIFKSLAESTSGSFSYVAPLFAIAALLKSAQFPIHGWLLEVMETPTPVSALLHAGIINAGGFLLIRFSVLVSASPTAMNTLLVVGAVTAIFGSLVMLTQTSIKVSLAYSTIAQMGFMMLECGLGMFSAAMLHIIAHSLYKAHAFLSSGETVKRAQPPTAQAKMLTLSKAFVVSSLIVLTALLTVTAVGYAIGSTIFTNSGGSTLSYVFALGLTILVSTGLQSRLSFIAVASLVVVRIIGVMVVFYAVQFVAESLFANYLAPHSKGLSLIDLFLRIGVVLAFSAVTILQGVLPHTRGSHFWFKFYVHLSNGFYINTIANKFAIRFWPRPAPRSTVPQYIPTYEVGGKT